jgi:hypothetical protein
MAMERILRILPVLALGAALAAAPPDKPAAKAGVATPAPLSADQGISPEDLIAVHATPYRPTLIRDPFSAPTDAEQTNKGDLVDDIAVKGRVVSRGKALAVVSDARGNIRMIGPGYKFRDGELVAVDEKTVTFHQWDASSSNTRVYRTVVKTFKREEGKR